MEFDPVVMDIIEKDEKEKASIGQISIESEGELMVGVLFKAQGRGPHPAAIILHGFPGHDRNLDIAHTLRRGGVSSLVFHYRGAWGSEGIFRFSNMVPDVLAAVGFLRSNQKTLRLDPERISLIGHSMGGWAGLLASMEDPSIRSVASLSGFNLGVLNIWLRENRSHMDHGRAMLKDLSMPLRIENVESLLKELFEHGTKWDLKDRARELSGKRILLVWSKFDNLSIPQKHFHPLNEAFSQIPHLDLTTRMIDSDHSYSDSRIELQRTIWKWIEKDLVQG